MPKYPTSSARSTKAPKRAKVFVRLPPASITMTALRPMPALPLEIYTYILELADCATLASAARVNSTFQHEAETVLYKDLFIWGSVGTIALSRSLLLTGRKHRITALRRFRPFVVHDDSRDPDLAPSIKSILDAASNLTDLSLEIPCSIPIAPDKPIQLKRLHANQAFDDNMLDLLAKVPFLKTLCIMKPSKLSTVDSSIVPALESIEGTGAVVALFVPHRPVRKVKVLRDAWEDTVTVGTLLDALAKSTVHLEHLSLFVSHKSSDVLAAVAQRLPHLRTLEIQNIEPSHWVLI
ncbi:hypothetical protein BOTBODRAFT_192046, partial [Botryobasidium botryosum FD-172 SS1]